MSKAATAAMPKLIEINNQHTDLTSIMEWTCRSIALTGMQHASINDARRLLAMAMESSCSKIDTSYPSRRLYLIRTVTELTIANSNNYSTQLRVLANTLESSIKMLDIIYKGR